MSCSADGTVLSSRRVAAGPEGVTFAVSSTMGDDGYLFFDTSEYRFGEPLPPLAEAWVRPVPPGVVELTCSADRSPGAGMSADVRVEDPEGHWREATLGDAGCTMTGGRPSWAFGPQAGDTAQEAVDALLAVMTAGSGRTLTANDAGLGYPDAATQTWVALSGDGRGFTIDVIRGETGYSAGPNYLCGGTGKPPI